ncbi:hypothetical protein BH23CHL5_BH23CHL5_12840 [soil metagenome]
MHRVTIIAPPCLEATSNNLGKLSGLAQAGAALFAAGLPDKLAAMDVAVDRITQPELGADQSTGEPVSDLGAYNAKIAGIVSSALASGSFPLLAGGSCNHLPGVIGGLQRHFGPTSKIGLLWLDAHGDFNTPRTTRSGMLGGMPVAVISGLCHPAWRIGAGIVAPIPTDRMMMIDVRSLDEAEEALIRATDISIVRHTDPGGEAGMLDAVSRFAQSVELLYVHIDADILDASLQPNHPTVEPNGLSVDQTMTVVANAMQSGKVVAFGVVSIPTEPGGETSLSTGLELLTRGVDQWKSSSPAYTSHKS